MTAPYTYMYTESDVLYMCEQEKHKHWIFLNGRDYLKKLSSFNTCQVMVKRQQDYKTMDEWIMGTPFNRAYYSVYDQEKSRVGFIGMPGNGSLMKMKEEKVYEEDKEKAESNVKVPTKPEGANNQEWLGTVDEDGPKTFAQTTKKDEYKKPDINQVDDDKIRIKGYSGTKTKRYYTKQDQIRLMERGEDLTPLYITIGIVSVIFMAVFMYYLHYRKRMKAIEENKAKKEEERIRFLEIKRKRKQNEVIFSARNQRDVAPYIDVVDERVYLTQRVENR